MVGIGDESSATNPVALSKEPPERASAGPAWIVVPARIVALIVVLPLRVVYDLVRLVARGVRTGLLNPVGRLLGAVLRGLGAVLSLLVVRPVRWLAVVVVLGFLRWSGRGTGRLARWIHRVLLVPIGTFLALVGRGLGRLAGFLIFRPLRWLLAITGRGLGFLFAGIALVFGVLVVLPASFLWRYVLRPALRGLGAFARALGAGIGWSWRQLGRFLGWLAHVLIVVPARTVWRYLLSPVLAGARGAWRLAARLLGWLWRTFVVVPVRVLVVAPARWVGTAVLRPLGRGVRATWRVTVGDPVRAVRRTMRDAVRDVRLQLRRTFGER
ncbi:hypothetical protein [Actinomadura decatromicini]|uniref:Uncharacterized protein n=1 Tax=Actinomadura decatromicini TaxID=2604572 RepID=A0A5D3FRE3_9ACTN|nr:hypothetical protein [Actinomadura decatromicini]TYK50911.1 hypothetical protein FXF68_10650 [Actinomadura decatromicini]